MSKYTTELRYICEKAAGLDESVGYLDVPEIINNSRPYIFDFDYPIFDNSYKSVLETKIIRHFYTREIAFETVGLWKLKLWTKLNEIMPYYNKLYNSELLEFNPFYDVDLTTDHVKNNEGEAHREGEGERDITNTYNTDNTQTNNLTDTTEVTSESTTTGSQESSGNKTGHGNDVKWDYYSDTPQGNIYDFPGEAHDNATDQMTYLTNARKNTDAYDNSEAVTNESEDTSTTTSEGESTTSKTGTVTDAKRGTVKTDDDNTFAEDNNFNNTEDYLQHVKGKSGGTSYSKLLEEYRKTFLNIDMLVIKDLEPLFMHLW